MTIVPKLSGMEYNGAAEELNKAKLTPENIEEISEKVEEGYVIRQEPLENTEAKAGDTVKVYVSKGNGKEQVPVISVVGKSEVDAKKQLEDAKLKVEIVYEEDTSKSDGIVLKQNKEVGEVVEEGTTIILTVNKISQIKEGTVNINLKSLLGYKEPVANEEVEEDVPTAKVSVEVNGYIVYEETHKKDTSKITTKIQGKGTVTVRIIVDGVQKAMKDIDLNSSNPVINFE